MSAPVPGATVSARHGKPTMGSEYEGKSSSYFANSRPEMLEYVPAAARSLLEVGCGQGGFSALVRSRREIRITAIEPFPSAAKQALASVDELLESSVEDGIALLADRQFDCIVFNDVLEHLVDPTAVLARCRPLLSTDGVIVASIPNIRYVKVLLPLVWRGEWTYADEGVLDRTHLRFFTAKSIPTLFAEAGYDIESLNGINRIRRSWKSSLLSRVGGGRFEDTLFQQFALTARVRR